MRYKSMEDNAASQEALSTEVNETTANKDPLPEREAITEYIKEKNTLKTELKEKDKEINRLKSTVYDLTNKLEETRKRGKHKNKDSSSPKDSPSVVHINGDRLGGVRPSTGKTRTPSTKRRVVKRKKGKHSKSKSNVTYEPIVMRADMDKYESVPEVISHYVDVAETFPEIKLALLLEAEKLFYESDINNDGLIDEDEMEKMLMKQGYLYTSAELKSIMSEMDVDNNHSIELMEYLTVLNKIQQQKKVNLPQELTKSKLCVVQ